MPADYLFQLHGPYSHNGAKQLWWPERTDNETSLEATLDSIEDFEAGLTQRLAKVIKIDGAEITDATAEIENLLNEREADRARERRAESTWGDRADHARALQMAE